jgi:hypothetical protein
MVYLEILIKNALIFFLQKFNLRLTTFSHFKRLQLDSKNSFDFNFISTVKNKEKLFKTLKYMPMSKSQFRQDLFVLNQLNFKKKVFL